MLGPAPHGAHAVLPSLTGSTVGRFRIGERLGQGGMGEVYLAEDPMLRRRVAIKRIAPELSADKEYRSRFLKEAERASSLSNQHVAVVHDVLEDHGTMFLVMEYVEGETLRQRMKSLIPIEQFFAIATQCVDGIAAAHRRGILHCDIKPENIMICPDGEVKILDFGLAKQLPKDPEATVDVENPSSSGISGTPAYMAPEVLLEKPADARSDIFSLGVVFYEMLTGHHPFRSDGFVGTIDRILNHEPEHMGASVPAAVEALILKMLAKNARERYARAEDVADEIAAVQEAGLTAVPWQRWVRSGRRIARTRAFFAAALLLFVVLGAFALLKAPAMFTRGNSVPLPPTRQLAVLPFQISDSDAASRAYGLGLSETLTTRLAELSSGLPLQVVSPGDVRAQSIRTAEQARIHYGANLVLEGTLTQSGSQMRVHYTLVNPEDRRVLRAGMIAGAANDPFGLEDRVVQSVLNSLELELAKGTSSAAVQARTQQPQAYDFYLRGRGYLQEYDRAENLDNAIQVFQRSLASDPNYALAHAGLGESYRYKYDVTHDPDWMARGKESCQKAASLAPTLPNGHICLGIIATHSGQYEIAVGQFKKALAIAPNNEQARIELALALEKLGKFGEAETTYKSAVSLMPQYWSAHNRLGRFYLSRGRYSEAIEQFEQVIALAPDSFRGYSNLGAAYLMTARFAEAIPKLEKSFAIRPNAAAGNNLGAAYFYMRRYDDAAKAYEKAAALDQRDYTIVGNVAEALYWGNKKAEATTHYRNAIRMAKKQLETNPKHEITLRAVAMYSAMVGERDQALEYDRRARAASGVDSKDPEAALSSAIVHAKLGARDAAFRYLSQAVERGLSVSRIKQSPNFDHLQDDERMKLLLKTAQ